MVLLVDDDQTLARVITEALSRYETTWASDGRAALHLVEHDQPDLVLLDLRLPDIDGLQLVGLIRKLSSVPIIITSARAETVDRVIALQTGADDFVAKPFDLDDLEARIEAVLRRSTRIPEPLPPETHQVGALTISATNARIAGKPVLLSPTEHRILMVLAEHKEELVTFVDLSERVWGDNLASPGLIQTHISRVRIRLREHSEAPELEAWRRRGYVLRTVL